MTAKTVIENSTTRASQTSGKLDPVIAAAVDLARAAAVEQADDFGVGEYLGCVSEGSRLGTHMFTCPHPGYPGWYWAVVLVRAARAKQPTVSEVLLLPGQGALLAPDWVPWSERLQPEDLGPGTLLPTADNDPRLEPGFTNADIPATTEPAEASQIRAVVSELGLGRERVLSALGRDLAAERWAAGEGGADTAYTRMASGMCATCGYFLRLSGQLGRMFGVCANEFTPFDGHVVTVDHGCGGHSDVVEERRGVELNEPIFDTITADVSNLFS